MAKIKATKDEIIAAVSDFFENYQNVIDDVICDTAYDDLNKIKEMIGYKDDISEEFNEKFGLDSFCYVLTERFKHLTKEELEVVLDRCKIRIIDPKSKYIVAESDTFNYNW